MQVSLSLMVQPTYFKDICKNFLKTLLYNLHRYYSKNGRSFRNDMGNVILRLLSVGMVEIPFILYYDYLPEETIALNYYFLGFCAVYMCSEAFDPFGKRTHWIHIFQISALIILTTGMLRNFDFVTNTMWKGVFLITYSAYIVFKMIEVIMIRKKQKEDYSSK